MCILKCFEEVSGLRVNYNKSKLYGFGVNEVDLRDMARWMRCRVGEFPFTYLGLPIGENMRRVGAWNTVMVKVKNLLAYWKSKSMSFEGRLTLVKSVIGRLPLYYCSMFRVPLRVKHWATLEEKSSSFRKMMVEIQKGGALWVRVIKSIHGESGGFSDVRGSVKGAGKWGMVRILNFGLIDGWAGLGFMIDFQDCTIKIDIRRVGWWKKGNGLIMFGVGNGNGDRWRWVLQESGDFTMIGLTKLVEEKLLNIDSGGEETTWNNWVPKKVNIFV
ncbi:hypothetical protein Tco_0979836 [Tanacetum coccineum]